MRLAQDQVHAIKSVAQRVLGGDARVILFGSRTDDAQRGGDIDLLFETPHCVGNRATALGQLYASLIGEFGDRKIDVLLSDPDTPDAPVLRIARETGVVL
jgi:hypothetical protein